jgi:hypothetical protein
MTRSLVGTKLDGGRGPRLTLAGRTAARTPRRALERLDVRGCRALRALLGVEAHFRALGQ